jgi:crossover junction endodeoxyribonuclease RusA
VTEIRLTLPLPAKALHPNARVHWRVKAKAIKASRQGAHMRALDVIDEPPAWEKAETKVTFYFSTNRRRDADGLASSLKAVWDGIADAGIVANDSGLRHTSPEMCCDKLNPRVEITITEVRP